MHLFRLCPQKPRPTAGAGRTLGLGVWLVSAWLSANTLTRAQLGGASRAGKIVPDFAAIARGTLVRLPAPPSWESNREVSVWSGDDIKAEFARITDTPPRIYGLRSQFLRSEHAWLVAFNRWFRVAQKPLKMHFREQIWDCDDYANCFVAFADLLALRAGETRGSFCIGWATVYYQHPFAGIRAGRGHAVVIIGTSKGLFVLDPQDGAMISLREFPNRDTIEEVFF